MTPAHIRLLCATAAVGLTLAACGDDDEGDPIPGGKAAELVSRLDAVRENFDQDLCDEAADAVADARATADTLDEDGVGSDVQDAITDGIENLGSLVSADCEEEVETTPETTPEPTITETTPEPTTPEPTTPEPTIPEPAPEPEPEPDEDDGSGQFDPGGAEVPPGQQKKLDGDD